MNITQYKTIVFDCDGVILNSNKVKTEAFYKSALPYGNTAAQTLVDYHVAHGGISRYQKFEWFITNVVAEKNGPNLEQLLQTYANEVRHGLLTCEISEGLAQFRDKTSNTNWLVVSGGDQQELRDIFSVRGIASLFDGGIFGSPDNKHEILKRELKKGKIEHPALFIGDSKYDLEAAQQANLEFAYISAWSEWYDSPSYVKKFNFHVNSIKDLCFI